MQDRSAELVLLAGKLIRQLRRATTMPISYRVLATLDDIGPAGITQLAEADGISQPTMSVQVAVLVEAGYVSKEPHPGDARANVLTMTEAGRAHLQASRECVTAIVKGRLGDHTEAEIDTAIAVLTSLTEKGPP